MSLVVQPVQDVDRTLLIGTLRRIGGRPTPPSRVHELDQSAYRLALVVAVLAGVPTAGELLTGDA